MSVIAGIVRFSGAPISADDLIWHLPQHDW